MPRADRTQLLERQGVFEAGPEHPANTDPIPTQLQGDDLISLTLALLTAGLAGLMFRNTRSLAIACLAAVVLLHPLAFLVFLAVGGLALYVIHFR